MVIKLKNVSNIFFALAEIYIIVNELKEIYIIVNELNECICFIYF